MYRTRFTPIHSNRSFHRSMKSAEHVSAGIVALQLFISRHGKVSQRRAVDFQVVSQSDNILFPVTLRFIGPFRLVLVVNSESILQTSAP